jgi:pimeloyl-ACP methyl ester carboxylesterase
MKRTIVTLCFLALTAINLFSQKSDSNPPVAIDSGYIVVDGGKLFYETAGKGENIVLLHDGMVSLEVWDEQFPLLAKSYRVVRYDRRTYGKSSDPQAPYNRGGHMNPAEVLVDPQKTIHYFVWEDPYEMYSENIAAKEKVGKILEGYNHSYKDGLNKPPDRPAVTEKRKMPLSFFNSIPLLFPAPGMFMTAWVEHT